MIPAIPSGMQNEAPGHCTKGPHSPAKSLGPQVSSSKHKDSAPKYGDVRPQYTIRWIAQPEEKFDRAMAFRSVETKNAEHVFLRFPAGKMHVCGRESLCTELPRGPNLRA